MKSVARMIKAKTISFTEELLSNYKILHLNETEAIALILLNRQLEQNNSLLDSKILEEKMTLTKQEVSSLLVGLVKKGYLELLITDLNESFSLDGIINAIASVISDDKTESLKSKEDYLSQIVMYVESTYSKILTNSDLLIINNWVDSGYSFDEIKSCVLESLKAKKLHLKYADAILVNRRNQSNRSTVAYDEDIKQMIDGMYGKK